MIEAARERLAPFAAQVDFVVADLMAPLPLPEASVDAILSTATFHWIPDHDRLFGHLARVLRPGGRLVAQCGGDGNIASVRAAVAEIGGDWPDPWTFATPEDTRRRLEAAGFEAIETWLNDEPTPVAPGRADARLPADDRPRARTSRASTPTSRTPSSTPWRRGCRRPRSTTCA